MKRISLSLVVGLSMTYNGFSDQKAFQPITVHIPNVTAHSDLDAVEIREFTLFGKVYPAGGYPVAISAPQGNRNDWGPYELIAAKIFYIKSGQMNKVVELFHPSSQSFAETRLNDPALHSFIQDSYGAVSNLTVFGHWLESPDIIVVYADQGGLIRPFILKHSDNMLHVVGDVVYGGEMTKLLDNLFSSTSLRSVEVTEPPEPEQLAVLLSNADLVSFNRELLNDLNGP